jgi:hypothetical protein
MSAAILYVWVRAQPQQQRYHLEATCAGCEVQECFSGKTPRREGRLTLHSIDREANQPGAARLNHPRQQSNEHRRAGGNLRCESKGFMVMAGSNCADDVIQKALLAPTRGQFLMLRPGSLLSYEIGGTMQEELTQGVSRPVIEWSRFERCRHLLQPSAPLGGANPETRVRFAQAQPPSILGLLFIATQELNEEGAKLFDGAPQAFAWKQRAQKRVLANTSVKLRRQPLATGFTAERFQESCTHT